MGQEAHVTAGREAGATFLTLQIQAVTVLVGDDVGTAIAGYRTRYALHGSDNALLALVFEEVDCRLDFGPHRPWWKLACG